MDRIEEDILQAFDKKQIPFIVLEFSTLIYLECKWLVSKYYSRYTFLAPKCSSIIVDCCSYLIIRGIPKDKFIYRSSITNCQTYQIVCVIHKVLANLLQKSTHKKPDQMMHFRSKAIHQLELNWIYL